jgi:hypothetical protein
VRARARVDPRLAIELRGRRSLRYDDGGCAADDRPAHVRAASGLAWFGGRLIVAQDDASFLAAVTPTSVTAVALPRGAGGRRRFEEALGNKAAKLDLEACVVIDDALWAIGSGSTRRREQLVRLAGNGEVEVVDAAPLYGALREALAGALNLEGAAVVGDELWLCHRGNTGAGDPGPAIARLPLAATRAFLAGGVAPGFAVDRYDLGAVAGVALGFTDAAAGGDRVFYLAAGEASANAVDDGAIAGSQLGVIAGGEVRAAALVDGGAPLKAEGLALDPTDPTRAWVVVDPDDPEAPATLLELALLGPWWSPPATPPR